MNNPLSQYMRAVKFYITLPSQGKYYTDDVIEFTDSNEIGIMPMTSMDEISLNTPDALLNGEGIKNAIKSCVPAIKDPDKILMSDFDVILLAIRRASFGDKINLSTKCENCEHENEIRLSITALLDNMKKIEQDYFIDINQNIRVYVKPSSFKHATYMALQTLETSRILESIKDNKIETDELINELKEKYNDSILKIANLNVKSVVDNIDYVLLNKNERISNPDHIKDWLFDLDAKTVHSIKKVVDEIPKPLQESFEAKCEKCEHEVTYELEYNPSDFFELGS